MYKIQRLLFLIILLPIWGLSQDCAIQLTGLILDKGTNIPLPYSNVYLEEQGLGAVSDSTGFFKFIQLCEGDYHLDISHIGCEPTSHFISISKDTFVQIYLNHHAELLDEVVIHGKSNDNSTQISSTVSRENIEQNSHKNLSDILESIVGVSSLKNGSGISKPVIHGLYGNRVAILNNGIQQSGQQWGNDHAPEIDPFIANHLSVIKGASALAYGSNSLGSVVLVETDKIRQDPHLHGSVNYSFHSNGLGNTLNTQLEKNGRWAAWRVSGTLKVQGDSKSPDYFLTNTGKKEGNIAIQLEKKISDYWHNSLYFSSFNTQIGVLRGSHIGNLTDLSDAIGKEEPFFTESNFSYEINAPRQKVHHHLVKLESKYFFDDHRILKFKYGGQLNNRQEFDIRRGNRSDIPALSLEQYSNFLELAYNQELENGGLVKTGLQFNLVDNTNNPETGILPLIPNYDGRTSSAYFIFQKEMGNLFYELGGRYDFKKWKVATISNSLPRIIERFTHNFHNYSFSTGIKYTFSEGLKTNLNAGYMLRAPEVNELYSSGLHQGVSGIEEGNRTLNSEKSIKVMASADWYFQKKLFIQALVYYQNIQDYIYLQPQNEFRLTIRGAFPVFLYEQTNAQLFGTDILLSYEPKENLKWLFKYSSVNGKDLTNNLALINIPANNLFTSFTWSFKDIQKLTQNSISINAKYVFEQQDILQEQDFLAPPDAYFLLGVTVGTNLQLNHSKIRLSLSIENLLNTTYRDYLNRLRYFADDTGMNVILNLNYSF
jgi:iron complex outermembrane receptor protein